MLLNDFMRGREVMAASEEGAAIDLIVLSKTSAQKSRFGLA
jgi:hypothetical protein